MNKNHKDYQDLNIQQLLNYFNAPANRLEKTFTKNINNLITKLCQKKVQLKISPKGKNICMLCFMEISLEEKYYNLPCSCCESVHVSCFKNDGFYLLTNPTMKKLACVSCQRSLTQDNFLAALGPMEFNRLLDEERKKKNKMKENEELDMEIARKLQAEERKKIEAAVTFTCNICFSEMKIEENCITLDCEHRFCDECLRGNLKSKMDVGKCNPRDLACPSCNKPIIHNILSTILKNDIKHLDEIMMKSLSQSILVQGEVFLKCPKGDCNNVVVLSINDANITHHKCEVCGLDFCVRGCPKPHRPKTCEEHFAYLEEQKRLEEERRLAEIQKIQEEAKRQEEMIKFNAWKAENDKAEDKFNMLAQQEKLRNCPNCKAWVQKTEGCNYILCRCKYEFCYICGAHYPGHRSQCGH